MRSSRKRPVSDREHESKKKEPLTYSQLQDRKEKQAQLLLQLQSQSSSAPLQPQSSSAPLQNEPIILNLETRGVIPPDFGRHKQTAIVDFITKKYPQVNASPLPSPRYLSEIGMTQEEQYAHEQYDEIRRRQRSPGDRRSSPTRENMTARELSELVKTEIPPLPNPEYESDKHKRKFNWGGKTKRKKRRKPKTKRKKLTKKRKHKKRKSTRKK